MAVNGYYPVWGMAEVVVPKYKRGFFIPENLNLPCLLLAHGHEQLPEFVLENIH